MVVREIVDGMLESENSNTRDIPRKICFLSELPTNAMSKNDFRVLSAREPDGSEYTINIDENNLFSGRITIEMPVKRINNNCPKGENK